VAECKPLASGTIALLFNNVQGDQARWPLSMALSEDQGVTWGWVRDLEPDTPANPGPGPGPGGRDSDDESLREADSMGEYSYPSLVGRYGLTISNPH
jgi:hypothetical protein